MGIEARQFPNRESQSERRVSEAVRMIEEGRFQKNQIPAAIRQVLLNDHVANENDIQNAIKELASKVRTSLPETDIPTDSERHDDIWKQGLEAKRNMDIETGDYLQDPEDSL